MELIVRRLKPVNHRHRCIPNPFFSTDESSEGKWSSFVYGWEIGECVEVSAVLSQRELINKPDATASRRHKN